MIEKLLLSGTAALTGFVGILYVVFSFSDGGGSRGLQIVGGLLLAALGTATLAALWRERTHSLSAALRVGAILLVPLSVLSAGWTIRAAQSSGDWEYYALAGAGVLLFQGILGIRLFRDAPA